MIFRLTMKDLGEVKISKLKMVEMSTEFKSFSPSDSRRDLALWHGCREGESGLKVLYLQGDGVAISTTTRGSVQF